MLDLARIEIEEIQVHPVIPVEQEFTTYMDEAYSQLREKIYEKMTLSELVLDLWRDKVAADSIAKIAGIELEELAKIIPKSRWFGRKWIKCRTCRGSGGNFVTTSWEEANAK